MRPEILFIIGILGGILAAPAPATGGDGYDTGTIYDMALNMSPENPNRWTVLGEKYIQDGDYSRAEEMYREGLSRYPDDPNILNDLGLLLIDLGRYQEATDVLNHSVSLKPYAVPYLINLGTAYGISGNYSQAVYNFEKAVNISPSYLTALNNLDLAYLNTGNYQGVMDLSLRSLRINSGDPVPWINLGLALAEERHYHEAEKVLLRGILLNPTEPDRKQAKDALARLTESTNASVPLSPYYSGEIDDLLHAPVHLDPRILYPVIIPIQSESEPIPVTITFPYGDREHTIHLDLNRSLYQGAKASYKGSLSNEGRETDSVIDQAGFYSAVIHEPYEQSLIGNISYELRKILNEYPGGSFVDIATAFVRASEPDLTSTELHYPIETIANGKSDCDDRTVLLASLLSREGYNVAVLQFPDHVVLGVTDEREEYKGSGYTVIDPTQSLPPGVIGHEYDYMPLTVIPIIKSPGLSVADTSSFLRA